MQSGIANTRKWVLEFEPTARKDTDPLMGWTGSADTRRQVRLSFSSREEAVDFAERRGLKFRLQDDRSPRIRPKSYAGNFSVDRRY